MVFYFVQRGETLYAIARRYQTTVHAIVAANRLEDPNAICPGQALIIPRPGEVPSPPPGGIVHLVRPGETVFHLTTKFGTTPHEILRANQIAHPEFILPGQQLVIPERLEAADDWPMYGRTPGRCGAGPVTLEGIPAEGWNFKPRKHAGVRPSAPVIRYDRVYVGLCDGHFYSLDRHTGRVKWRFPAGDAEAMAGWGEYPLPAPALFDGLVYLCSPGGDVYALDAYTGQQVWQVAVGGPVTAPPAVSEGILYLGCCDEHLYALETKTGCVAWKRHVGAPVLLPVAVGDEQLFAVSADGILWAVDAQTGESCWSVPAVATRAPIFAEVVVLAGERAHDPRNGQVLWEVDAGGVPPVARLDQIIYPGGVIDLFSGGLRELSGPAGTDTVQVEQSSEEGTPSPVAGDSLTVLPPPTVPVRHLVATGALVLAVGLDQRLYGYGIGQPSARWSVDLPAPCRQPPAVGKGQCVLSLEDGSVQSYPFTPGKSRPGR